jgi:DNA-binding FadR family transcriptional regulator
MRLEGLAARCAAERISDEEKKRLRDSVELAEFYIRKNDAEHLKELDTEFHSIIYAATGNRMLTKMLAGMHKSIKSYRKMSLSVKGRHEKSVEEHRDILCAIEAGDADKADMLTHAHISAALDNILTSLNSENA